jgi:hypothetical protein
VTSDVRRPLTGSSKQKGESGMKIQIKRVEAIKATRIHLDPDAGGA